MLEVLGTLLLICEYLDQFDFVLSDMFRLIILGINPDFG